MTDIANTIPKRKIERKNITSLTWFASKYSCNCLYSCTKLALDWLMYCISEQGTNFNEVLTQWSRRWSSASHWSRLAGGQAVCCAPHGVTPSAAPEPSEAQTSRREEKGMHMKWERDGEKEREVVPRGGNKRKTKWLNNKRIHLHTPVHLWAYRPTWAWMQTAAECIQLNGSGSGACQFTHMQNKHKQMIRTLLYQLSS